MIPGSVASTLSQFAHTFSVPPGTPGFFRFFGEIFETFFPVFWLGPPECSPHAAKKALPEVLVLKNRQR
jgi:hypothetical protein